jgi:hypothetical protein
MSCPAACQADAAGARCGRALKRSSAEWRFGGRPGAERTMSEAGCRMSEVRAGRMASGGRRTAAEEVRAGAPGAGAPA